MEGRRFFGLYLCNFVGFSWCRDVGFEMFIIVLFIIAENVFKNIVLIK